MQPICDQEAALVADPIDREFVREAVRLYHPGDKGRPHPVEWLPEPIEGKLHFGGSSIVKKTAWEYADRVVRQAEDVDEHDSFYGEQGNKLAEVHFNALTPYQENQVRIPLGTERDFIAHIDAILVYDLETGRNLSFDDPSTWSEAIGLRTMEHKHQDFSNADEAGGKVDLAERQAVLCQALLRAHILRLRSQGRPVELIVPPDFNEGRTVPAKPLRIPGHVTDIDFSRVSTHFWPRNDPRAGVHARRLEITALQAMLDFYVRKAKCIQDAVDAKDANVALSWDTGTVEGLQEFRRTPSAWEVGIDPSRLLKLCLEHAYASAQVKKWDAVKDDRSATAVALLKEKGAKTCEVELDGKVVAKPTAANTAGSKSQFLKPNLRIPDSIPELEAALADFELRAKG
jgi:hypothetical protein